MFEGMGVGNYQKMLLQSKKLNFMQGETPKELYETSQLTFAHLETG